MQLAIELRPRKLSEVYGNPLIVTSLKNRAKKKEWPTATLMKGMSGCGKSTLTSIMANMINCTDLQENGDPCLKCPSCLSVISERWDRDIQMLNGGVSGKEDVIDFTQLISTVPFYDRNKSVYVIEEADQLSTKAVNSLLKTLESPQDNVHFILLSMESNGGIKLPNSSRCQTYQFNPFMKKDVLLGLQNDLKRSGYWGLPEIPKTFYTEVLPAIASASQGSYRQSLQDVESCIFAEAWTPDEYVELTGHLDGQTISDVLSLLLNRKKGFFMEFDRIKDASEFFFKSYDILAKAVAYKKTGVLKNDFFEDQIKELSIHENLKPVLDAFSKTFTENPVYLRKAHAISHFADLY